MSELDHTSDPAPTCTSYDDEETEVFWGVPGEHEIDLAKKTYLLTIGKCLLYMLHLYYCVYFNSI